MFTMLGQLNEAVSQKAQKAAMKEWREVSAELEVFSQVAKKMAARVKELEAILIPAVKEMTEQKGVIDNAILEVKMTSGKTTVSYSELYNRALEIATADQKAVLEAFKKSIEKVGEGSESLKIVDPALQKKLTGFTNKLSVDEMKQKMKDIVKMPDDVHEVKEGSIMDKIRSAIRYIKDAFKPFIKAQETAGKSADALLKLAKKPELASE